MDDLRASSGETPKSSVDRGRVLEVKVSAGSVLSVGTPVIAIGTSVKLEAVIVHNDQGKNIKPGIPVHLAGTVKRGSSVR